jgi:hypothetical protein
MKQLIALAWKEYREVRWVLGFAVVIYVALPVIGGVESLRMSHRLVFEASPWIEYTGGVLATIVAVTSVCRDLKHPIAEFWQARAVSSTLWLLIKYCVGLAILMIACIVPLLIEEWTADFRSNHAAAAIIEGFPLVWAVQYSLGFVCACVIRRPAPAIMLALALSLLVYCLPIILPPLHAFSFTEFFRGIGRSVSGEGQQIPSRVGLTFANRQPFIVAAAGITICSLVFSLMAVGREWKIESPQRLTVWSMGGVLLVLFGSASFQLATNLPILQSIDIAPSGDVLAIYSDGHRGLVVTGSGRHGTGRVPIAVRPFTVRSNQLEIGEALKNDQIWDGRFGDRVCAWLPGQPDLFFRLAVSWRSKEVSLIAFRLSPPDRGIYRTLSLGTSYVGGVDAQLIAVGDRLYASWCEDANRYAAAVIDVSDMDHLKARPARPYSGGIFGGPGETNYLWLPPVPGVPVSALLAAATDHGWLALQGDLLVRPEPSSLVCFNVLRVAGQLPATQKESTGSGEGWDPRSESFLAELHRVGVYQPTLLEKFLDLEPKQIRAANGLIYVSQQSETLGFPSVTVFDVADPTSPRPIGHFAVPADESLAICALPDGQVLVGGHKLYLLGAPPRHP